MQDIKKYSIHELEVLKRRFQEDGDKEMVKLLNDEIRTKKIDDTLRKEKAKKDEDWEYDDYLGIIPKDYFKKTNKHHKDDDDWVLGID